ncbi:MAG: hypothetical protein ACYCQI_13625 [Gammaproteobacteria bacterium]
MKTESQNIKLNPETEKTLLSLAQPIIDRYHAKLERREAELVDYEGEKTCSLGFYVSGVSIETVVKMNINLATCITKMQRKSQDKQISHFVAQQICPDKKEELFDENLVPIFILCESNTHKDR